MNVARGFFTATIRRQLARRHGGLVIFFAIFLAISLLTRLVLLLKSAHDVSWTLNLVAVFFWGLVYDLGAASFAALPLAVLLTVLPARWFQSRWQQLLAQLAGLGTFSLLLIGAMSELTFWDEFGVRFNFIAVDYLVYTTEVVGNIRESYNLPLIFIGVFAVAGVFFWLLGRTGLHTIWFSAPSEPADRRFRSGAVWFLAALVFGSVLDGDFLPAFRNNFNRELAKNGLWSLFAAFRNNELDYEKFYSTLPPDEAFRLVRQQIARDGSVTLGPDPHDTLHVVRHEGPEQLPNVIQITVESLSADFLGSFNPASHLTPNLDKIAAESLVFDNFYATGTRTDRGMEALTLAVPPTPGRSIVKRPRNEGLFSLGSVFRAKGYATAFIYGGFGYFDNMNHFFGDNGYRVIDRNSVAKDDVTFANIWGACDEDLYRWTMREADADAAAGRPFHYFVMTTSNHRPYTFPEGRIDLPSKVSGRAGAVKYTDFAIGQFLREARKKAWFNNTVFVIVADHCASSAGKTELPIQNYHIPLIMYAPGGTIAPGRMRSLASQVDYPPTLLGLLNWSYPSRFFGADIRQANPMDERAFVGTYQKLGLLKGDDFLVLTPVRRQKQYFYNRASHALTERPLDPEFLAEAISSFQSASDLYRSQRYRELSPTEFQRLLARPAAP